jgi:hypothetical protein
MQSLRWGRRRRSRVDEQLGGPVEGRSGGLAHIDARRVEGLDHEAVELAAALEHGHAELLFVTREEVRERPVGRIGSRENGFDARGRIAVPAEEDRRRVDQPRAGVGALGIGP